MLLKKELNFNQKQSKLEKSASNLENSPIEPEERSKVPLFFQQMMKRISRTFQHPPTLSNSTKIKPIISKKNKFFSKITDFFGLIFFVMKAAKLFRSRTQYRNLNNVTDYHLDLIDDISYTKRNQTDRKTISFINNKFLRKTIRSLKNLWKRKKKYFIKILSIFTFC